ncbi:MAG: hypothetical protein KAY54_01750 [Burkholderiaceae bacterium]|nr:hypothetical protein [Burkholderiaceae bacterium]
MTTLFRVETVRGRHLLCGGIIPVSALKVGQRWAQADGTDHEVEIVKVVDGSMSAQKAACLEWLACGAEYQHMLRGGPRVSTGELLEAQENLVKQIRFLMA